MTDSEKIEMLSNGKGNEYIITLVDEAKGKVERLSLSDIAYLINRLQAQVKKCEKVEHFADKTIATLQAEIKRLKAEVKFSDYLEYETTNQIKAEAHKEFAEMIDKTTWYHINKNGELVQGANSITDIPLYKAEDIYNLLKELVGEDK